MTTFFQKTVSLKGKRRGCHLITRSVLDVISTDISRIRIGMLNLFLQHTSCALSINENACSDVQRDLGKELDRLMPDEHLLPRFEHTYEGSDDMSSHCKSSVVGVSLSIPINNGRLLLGQWQGIYFIECRDDPTTRNIVCTIYGNT
ncbi:hypothetical protein RCL1_003615 [Eukaryota sp. TZLM3-RCL]